VRHRLGLATRTQISVCKSPFPSADTAVSLFRAKTVQQRPLSLNCRKSSSPGFTSLILCDYYLVSNSLTSSVICFSAWNYAVLSLVFVSSLSSCCGASRVRLSHTFVECQLSHIIITLIYIFVLNTMWGTTKSALYKYTYLYLYLYVCIECNMTVLFDILLLSLPILHSLKCGRIFCYQNVCCPCSKKISKFIVSTLYVVAGCCHIAVAHILFAVYALTACQLSHIIHAVYFNFNFY